MTSCPEGRVCLFLGLLLFCFAGCGSVIRVDEPFPGDIPKANTHIAEIVIGSALKNAGIPGGQGVKVSFRVGNSVSGSGIVEIIAPDFLLKLGYIVSGKSDSIPEFVFSVDTLYVNLERAENSAGSISRFAVADILAVLTEPQGVGSAERVKKVFIGSAEYHDSFPVKMMEASETDEPYINRFPSRENFKNKIRPIYLGITMTALVWLLYSYRG